MVINDKLKGEFYRTPITKLASRNNILTTLNELVDYFNNIYELLDSNFNNITKQRESMKQKLLMIYERTQHFKYVLDHFRLDVDAHILERLNDAIENFQNRMTTFVTPYELNLFNHSAITDDKITSSLNPNSVEDWDRSVNMLASNLGIRWFGGKLSDNSISSEVNNLLHITKVNTYEGKKNEDYINSNLILEIFLYTVKGIIWLSLGKNGDFGYNIITKYRSPNSAIKMKIASEEYNTRQKFDTNVFDFDMILDTLIGNENRGNVYVKIKTNIPSNTESGKEGYFLNFVNEHEDFIHNSEVKKGTSEFSKGLMYHDNKDVAYFEHDNENVFDVNQKTSLAEETPMILNADTKDIKDFQTSTNEKVFYSSISSTSENNFVQSVYNPEEAKMVDLMDIVSGYIISNSSVKNTNNYFDDVKMNKKYEEGDKINYTKGENLVDISDDSFIGDLNLIAKNENMFGIENVFSKTKVVPSQIKYGSETGNQIIENNFTNNENFINISNNSHTQDADIILTPISDKNSLVYKVLKVDDKNTLIIKSDGIFRFNSEKNVSTNGTYTERLPTDNLFNVCYDALVKGSLVFLATDQGIYSINTSNFSVQNAMNRENTQTGVVGGEWSTLFETTDKKYIIALRKDFTTSVLNGRISYGESVAVYANNVFNVIRVVFNNDILSYTYDNPSLDNELTDTTRALDYSSKRLFQTEFKVIPNPMENKYYFFRYGHKMLVTDAANDATLNFKNFKYVEAMREYDIADAVLFDNKIYFTVYEGGNYYYDLDTNTVSEVQYTYTKVINNRNTIYKNYYMSKLSNLVGDNSDSTGITYRYVKLTPEEIEEGYVPGTKYYYPSIKTIHVVTLEERLLGPDPEKDYYGCIGNKMSVTGSWFIGKLEAFDNITNTGVENPEMNYGYIEYNDDGKFLDYTLAASIDGFNMDPDKIYKKITVEEVLPKINCFIKIENGLIFFIPNNKENEIRNVIYINGYYYFATNQNYIFKLDNNFKIVNTIRSEDCNEVLGDNNLLVIQNNKITSEEVTKNELYYDRVDGSEMINGYNSDLTYYKEGEVIVQKDKYELIDLDNPRHKRQMEYDLNNSFDERNIYVKENINGADTYRLTDSSDFDQETTEDGNPPVYHFKNDVDYYKLTYEDKTETKMIPCEVNDDNFILTPKYTPITSEEREQGIQPGTDYYIKSKEDAYHYEYDHISPEAKNKKYDSINNNDYYFGELALFDSSLTEEEKIGKSLYVMDQENRNYVFIGIYEGSEITALNPNINYYYDTKNYHRDYNNQEFTFYNAIDEYILVDKEKSTPNSECSYKIKHNSASDTPIYPGGTIYVGEDGNYYEDVVHDITEWDPNIDYYVKVCYYKIKDDIELKELDGIKTIFKERRVIDNSYYSIATNDNFKRIDEYDKLTQEEILAGPKNNVDYFVHPSSIQTRYSKVYNKSNGADPNETYYKLTSGNFEYRELYDYEIVDGPQSYERYFEYLGGVYLEVQYPLNSFDPNKTYYVIDYENSEYNFEVTTDFDSRYKKINKATYTKELNDTSIKDIYIKPSENDESRYEYVSTDDVTPVEGKEYYKLDESAPTTGHYVKVPFSELCISPDWKTYYIKRGENFYERVDDIKNIVGLNKLMSWYEFVNDNNAAKELFESIKNYRTNKSIELNMTEKDDDNNVKPLIDFDFNNYGSDWVLIVNTSFGIKQIDKEHFDEISNNSADEGYTFKEPETGETFNFTQIYVCLMNSFNTVNDEEYYTYEYDNYKQLSFYDIFLGPQANKTYFVQDQNNNLIRVNKNNQNIRKFLISPYDFMWEPHYGLLATRILYNRFSVMYKYYDNLLRNYRNNNNEFYLGYVFKINNDIIYINEDDLDFSNDKYIISYDKNNSTYTIINKITNEVNEYTEEEFQKNFLRYSMNYAFNSINYYTPLNPSFNKCNSNDFNISNSTKSFQDLEYYEKVEKKYELVSNVIKHDDSGDFYRDRDNDSLEVYYASPDYKYFSTAQNTNDESWPFDSDFYDAYYYGGFPVYKEYRKTYVKTQDTERNINKEYFSIINIEFRTNNDVYNSSYYNKFINLNGFDFSNEKYLNINKSFFNSFDFSALENIDLYIVQNNSFIPITYTTEKWDKKLNGYDNRYYLESSKEIFYTDSATHTRSYYTPYIKFSDLNKDFVFKYLAVNYELQAPLEYVQTTRDDYNYTGDFKNVQFKPNKNYYELLTYDPFKPDMDYFLKHEVRIFDKHQYEQNSNYKQKEICTYTSETSGNKLNIVKCKDIYTGLDAIYAFRFKQNDSKVYKYSYENHRFDELFTITDTLYDNSFLLSTNGKLFVIGAKNIIDLDVGYAVYDWMQDSTASWKAVALSNNISENNNYKIDRAILYENNTCLLIRSHKDNNNKDVKELFYYDYINRAFTKCTEIEDNIYHISSINLDTYPTDVVINDAFMNNKLEKSENNSILIEVQKSDEANIVNKEVYLCNLKCNRVITSSGSLRLENTNLYNGFNNGNEIESCIDKAFFKIFTFVHLGNEIKFYSSFMNIESNNDGVLYIVTNDKVYTIGYDSPGVLTIIDEEFVSTPFNHYSFNTYDNKRNGIYAVKFEYTKSEYPQMSASGVGIRYLFMHIPGDGRYKQFYDKNENANSVIYTTAIYTSSEVINPVASEMHIEKRNRNIFDKLVDNGTITSKRYNMNFINIAGINIDNHHILSQFDENMWEGRNLACAIRFAYCDEENDPNYPNVDTDKPFFGKVNIFIDTNKLVWSHEDPYEGVTLEELIIDNHSLVQCTELTLYNNYCIFKTHGKNATEEENNGMHLRLHNFNNISIPEDDSAYFTNQYFNKTDLKLNRYDNRSISLIYNDKLVLFDIRNNKFVDKRYKISKPLVFENLDQTYSEYIDLNNASDHIIGDTDVTNFIYLTDNVNLEEEKNEIMYCTYKDTDKKSSILLDKKEFEPDTEYFTQRTHYEFDKNIEYFLKSIIVNFKLDMNYFTQKVKMIVQNIIQHARSYTSTDKTSKLYHKSLLKEKLNSMKTIINSLNK